MKFLAGLLALQAGFSLVILCSNPTYAETSPKYSIVDGHFHYFNFVQETAGMKELFKAMDDVGVAESMISGMALVKKWDEAEDVRPTYYLDNDSRTYWYSATDCLLAQAVLSLPPEQRKRLHPFICGINAADRNAAEHVERMLAAYPGFWEGIGEIFCHHDDLTALTYGEVARSNTKSFDRLLDTAAKYRLPVIIHSNIGPAMGKQPSYLGELEYALANHPNVTIIWAHAGISRRVAVPNHVQIVQRLLQRYNNLMIDLSWLVFDQEIAPNGDLNRDWVALIEEYPTRFVIGSDAVGFLKKYKPDLQRYYVLLDALKPETARKVARDNFLSVLPAQSQQGK